MILKFSVKNLAIVFGLPFQQLFVRFLENERKGVMRDFVRILEKSEEKVVADCQSVSSIKWYTRGRALSEWVVGCKNVWKIHYVF